MNPFSKLLSRIEQYGAKRTFTVLLPRAINFRLERYATAISTNIFRCCKLKDTIVLESQNDFDTNGGAFYEWLIKNRYNDKYTIVWLLSGKAPTNLPYNVKTVPLHKPCIKKGYYLATSKYILTCHDIIGSCREDQISVYMTHGAFSLKSSRGMIPLSENVSYCLIPSKNVAKLQARQYELDYPNNKFSVVGFPCHDYLYSAESGDLHKLTSEVFSSIILWMPTFRKNSFGGRNDSQKNQPLGIPIFSYKEELEKLNEILKQKNSLLIIKIHPGQDLSVVQIPRLSNVIVIDAALVKKLGIDNYRLMKDVSAMISDYSSAAFDFLHCDKPIAYTVDDADSYKRGFIVENPEDYMGGPVIHNTEDFFGFIEDVYHRIDSYKDKRHIIFDKVFEYHDGNSCERLAHLIAIDNEK